MTDEEIQAAGAAVALAMNGVMNDITPPDNDRMLVAISALVQYVATNISAEATPEQWDQIFDELGDVLKDIGHEARAYRFLN